MWKWLYNYANLIAERCEENQETASYFDIVAKKDVRYVNSV